MIILHSSLIFKGFSKNCEKSLRKNAFLSVFLLTDKVKTAIDAIINPQSPASKAAEATE